jgi:hypothetical protein
MGRTRRLGIAPLIVLLAGFANPAEACRVPRPLPTRPQAAAVAEPRFGFAGRIMAIYTADETRANGQAIIQVDVTENFSGKLPPVIFVLDPGCCVCVGISGKRGDEVVTIVRRGDDGLFHLDY